MRAAAIAGVAIPGALGLFHAFYAPVLWALVIALAVYRTLRVRSRIVLAPALFVTLAAAILVWWPPLVRPLLDGDTLLYHLPNAVTFAQDHSLWTARAPYWFYPPASELFASGLFLASGQWSLPLAGLLPALLLTSRIFVVARESKAPAYAASSIALAFACMPVVVFQAGSLQNDLWLAAFFVEVVCGADRGASSAAICALLKPFGALECLVAAAVARLPARACALAVVPLGIWLVHDFILLRNGAAPGFTTPPYFSSTLAGNFSTAIPQLGHGIATVTPQSFVFLPLLLLGLILKPRRYAYAGCAALVIYAFLPVAYSNGVTNYVLDASSFRFALPALACAALIAAIHIKKSPIVGAIVAYAVAAWGVWTVLSIFWNDAFTHLAIALAIVAIAAAAVVKQTRGISVAFAALAIILLGRWGASSRAQSFYADWMRNPNGKPTGVFAWIAVHKPRTVVSENLRIGAILMSSPDTLVQDASASGGCQEATRRNALLVLGSNEGLSGANWATAVSDARSCGTTLYQDDAAIIVRPTPR